MKVQNELHYSVTGNTAAEIIYNRADASKEHMGLKTWDKVPRGRIHSTDVVLAIIERTDDIEDKLVVAPIGLELTDEEIEEAVRFQEQYFKHEIIT